MPNKKSTKKSKLSSYSGKTLARLVALKDMTAEGWHHAFRYERQLRDLSESQMEVNYDYSYN